MNQIINEEKVVFPHSPDCVKAVADMIDGWNIILCRICGKEKKREKFADHFAKHFVEQKEVPMTAQEIMNLVVPQIEK